MKSTYYLLWAIALLSGVFVIQMSVAINRTAKDIQAWKDFAAWKKEYNKQYDSQIDSHRFPNYMKNLKFITEFTSDSLSLKLNQFADLADEEFVASFLGFTKPESDNWNAYIFPPGELNQLPMVSHKNNAVNPVVQNQICGASWAYSAVHTLEFMHAHRLQTGSAPLSVKELIDCSPKNLLHQGCVTGTYLDAFSYTSLNGISTDQNYPNKNSSDHNCPINISELPKVYPNSGPQNTLLIVKNNVEQLKAALARTVVAIAIQADQPILKFYSSGIIKPAENCGSNVNHAVVAVGFDADFLEIQNSWGTQWGDSGFAKLSLNTAETQSGVCGFLSYPATSMFVLDDINAGIIIQTVKLSEFIQRGWEIKYESFASLPKDTINLDDLHTYSSSSGKKGIFAVVQIIHGEKYVVVRAQDDLETIMQPQDNQAQPHQSLLNNNLYWYRDNGFSFGFTDFPVINLAAIDQENLQNLNAVSFEINATSCEFRHLGKKITDNQNMYELIILSK